MSIKINFNNSIVSNPSSNKYLTGNMIHDVHLKSCEVKDQTTKNGEAKVLLFVFEDKDGAVIEEMLFEPRSNERTTSQTGSLNASEADLFQAKIQLFAFYMTTKLYDNLPKIINLDWEPAIKMLAMGFQEAVKARTEFKLKVVKNSSGYTMVPRYFLKFNKAGEPFVGVRFIGKTDKDVFFTEYELKRIQETEKNTVTKMTDILPTEQVFDTTQATATTQPNPLAGKKEEAASSDDWMKILGE